MKRVLILAVSVLVATIIGCGGGGDKKAPVANIDGKALFEANCAGCHKDGGNIINPSKTLHPSDLAANGIKKPSDIVDKMRNPGNGMPKFESSRISDAEAQAIAEYAMGAF